MREITAQLQYIINCQKCQNCWIANKQEVVDFDIISCPSCGNPNLNLSKTWEGKGDMAHF